MAVIIGIHGLANKPPKITLATGWKNAIVEGLQTNLGLAATPRLESVYWADIMYDEPIADDKQPYTPAEAGALKRYKDSWTDLVRARVLARGGSILDTAKELMGISATADEVLARKLPDLDAYYRDPDIRSRLRKRLKKRLLKFRDTRKMVIAHSMGSIIAYDVLREIGKDDPGFRVGHFVTIGSPLGLPHVKLKIKDEDPLTRTPSVVDQWTNFSDRRDPVALDIHLSDDYEANQKGVKVKDDLVINDYEGNPHKSYGYLRAPEVSDAIRQFL